MALNQKSTQPKRPKTNCFLSCFGFSPKTNSSKKKPKKVGVRIKKFFKLCWPKLKVITMEKKRIIFDAKLAALKATHNIILEATKVQQLKRVDHHVLKTKELIVPSKERKHQDNQSHPKNQSYCATCHNEDLTTPKVVKQSIISNKTTKDSLIGVLIMFSLLIVLFIWGRLCAILCMCGWLYCIPLLQGHRVVAPNQMNTKLSTNYLNSELYKKKVVLQGLLQRDHKIAIAVS